MTIEIETNQELPIRAVGKWFVITAKNNINGSIIFSERSGNLKAYTLNKYQRNEFNIEEMRNNEWVKFDPEFVEFRTSDDIEEISIDIAPMNPDKKLIQ
jgi:hypothetical protein